MSNVLKIILILIWK